MTDRGVIWSVVVAVIGSGLAQFGGPLWPAALEVAGRAADVAVQKLDLTAAASDGKIAPAEAARRAAADRAGLEARQAALRAMKAREAAAALERLVLRVPPVPAAAPVECTHRGVIVRVVTERAAARPAPAPPGSDA